MSKENADIVSRFYREYRKDHSLESFEYVSEGELLIWLCKKYIELKDEGSLKRRNEKHKRSLELLDEYVKTTSKEDIEELIGEVKGLRTSVPKIQWGVHRTHCCRVHGCKYNDEDCPVVVGIIKQEYKCESDSDISPCFPKISIMRDFISPSKPISFLSENKIDNFIYQFNIALSQGEFSINTGLHNIDTLTDEELIAVQEKARKNGYSLNAFDDNYQTTSYKLTPIK